MLVQFSVRNFKTFKEKATLSLVASNYDKSTREEENIIVIPDFNIRLVKGAVMYGANASGKSKFIDALLFMKRFVISSSKESQKGDPIGVEQFRLDIDSENDSTEFEIIFIHNNEMFRYGFEVDTLLVKSEWLYYKPKTKEIELFYREKQEFDIHERNFTKGATLAKEGLIRANALMLSVAAQFNDKTAAKVLEGFENLKIISGLQEDQYQGYTMGRTRNPKHKEQIIELLRAADLGIDNLDLEIFDFTKLPKNTPREVREEIENKIKEGKSDLFSDVLLTHRKYNANKKHVGDVRFSLDADESSGTKKFFALMGPILDSIENGYALIVDELDSKIHPNLVCKIVSIYNSKKLNPKDAQLIFNTHDTNLLSEGLFRRDQIWFIEKDKYGAAKLFSLADFHEVRKTESFEDNYIRGKYGAVPLLNDFEDFIYSKMLQPDENEA